MGYLGQGNVTTKWLAINTAFEKVVEWDLSEASANFICNGSSHWLRPCKVSDRKRTVVFGYHNCYT